MVLIPPTGPDLDEGTIAVTTEIRHQPTRAFREPAVGHPEAARSQGTLTHMYGCAMPGRGATCDCGAQPVPACGEPPLLQG